MRVLRGTLNAKAASLAVSTALALALTSPRGATSREFSSAPSLTLRPGRASTITFSTRGGPQRYYQASRILNLPEGYSRIELTLTDRSPAAIPKTLALAVIDSDGRLQSALTDASIESERSGTQAALSPIVPTATAVDGRTMSAAIRLRGPSRPERLLLLYNGTTASHFTGAQLEATFVAHSELQRASLFIATNPRITSGPASQAGPKLLGAPLAVAVSLDKNRATFGTGIPFGEQRLAGQDPFAPQIEKSGFDPTVDNNRIFVGFGNTVLQYLSDGAFTGVAFNAPAAYHKPAISGAATLNLGDDPERQMLYVSDMVCGTCTDTTGVGVIALDSDPTDGIGRDSIQGKVNPVRAVGNRIDFRSAGAPLGICALGPRQGSRSSAGTLYVAARNGIYAMDLVDNGPSSRFEVRAPRLIAGSGIPGSTGAGSRDGVASAARFRFLDAPVGIAADRLFGRATALYVADNGNRAIRRVALKTGSVTTYARLPAAPSGLTVDAFSGVVYATVPQLGALYAIVPNERPRIVARGLAGPTGLAYDTQSAAVVVTESARRGPLRFVR